MRGIYRLSRDSSQSFILVCHNQDSGLQLITESRYEC